MSKVRTTAAALFLAGSLIGCGGGLGAVTPHLIRLSTTTPDPAPIPTPITTYPTPTTAPLEATTAVNVDSFKIPVRSIELLGPGNLSSEIYHCDADTNDDCLIDLARAAGVDLLSPRKANVDAGTYDQVVVHTCMDEGSYTFQIQGSGTIGSTTYLTKSASYPANGGSIEATTMTVEVCDFAFPLDEAVTVKDGSTTEFSLYFDLRNSVWMGLKSAAEAAATPAAWLNSGCTGNLSDAYNSEHPVYVCASFPPLYGSVGAAPVEERYLLNNRAILGIYYNFNTYSTGTRTPIGGYLRRYYGSESPAGEPFGFDVALKTISSNADGSFSISAYGALPASTPYFVTADFPGGLNLTDNTTGTGTFVGALSGATSYDYTVMRLE